MRIYLVRHGDSANVPIDDERPLSKVGEDEIKKIAQFINKSKITSNILYHSHKLRAKQTASILATSFSKEPKLIMRDDMSPMHALDEVIALIDSSSEDIVLVGHMPFLGRLVSYLICQNENINIVDFQTGTMVCLIQSSSEQWAISWTVSPELF